MTHLNYKFSRAQQLNPDTKTMPPLGSIYLRPPTPCSLSVVLWIVGVVIPTLFFVPSSGADLPEKGYPRAIFAAGSKY